MEWVSSRNFLKEYLVFSTNWIQKVRAQVLGLHLSSVLLKCMGAAFGSNQKALGADLLSFLLWIEAHSSHSICDRQSDRKVTFPLTLIRNLPIMEEVLQSTTQPN